MISRIVQKIQVIHALLNSYFEVRWRIRNSAYFKKKYLSIPVFIYKNVLSDNMNMAMLRMSSAMWQKCHLRILRRIITISQEIILENSVWNGLMKTNCAV